LQQPQPQIIHFIHIHVQQSESKHHLDTDYILPAKDAILVRWSLVPK